MLAIGTGAFTTAAILGVPGAFLTYVTLRECGSAQAALTKALGRIEAEGR